MTVSDGPARDIIRVLIAKPGLDGHDVGAKVLCRALMEAGMEVVYTGLRQSPAEIARTALEEDVDIVGLSILSGAHLPLCQAATAALKTAGILGETLCIVGGNIPRSDHAALGEMGIAAVFATGSPFEEIVGFIRDRCGGRRDADQARLAEEREKKQQEKTEEERQEQQRPEPQRLANEQQQEQEQEKTAQKKTDEAARACTPLYWESGLEIREVYTQDDVERTGGSGDIGQPGEYPYTRGIHPLMYRKRPWTMRQYSGFGTAAETNERFQYLIRQGQTGLNVAFDLPTQCGLDSDDEMAAGEVGRVGMAVDTLADMETAFAGIDLDKITVSLTINGAAVPVMAMYFAMARKRGLELSTLRGTAQNDILKEFIGRGTWIFPVEASIRLVGDTIEYCAQNVPRYHAVSVCGYHIRESGASPAEEMAYGLAIARAYIDHTLARGLDIDEFAGGLSFNFDIHGNLWEHVAKFRAGRRLWARILKEEYGARNPRSMQLRMIAGGGGGGLTIEQPENNIVRGAYYALASALSGTQTMALCSYDEAFTIPSKAAARLSLRTMQILMHEVGACDTVDPLAGSYFVETTTNEMEQRIVAIMNDLETRGGIIQAVSKGWVQAQVNRRAYEQENRLRSGETRKVGVNCFAEEGEEPAVEFHPYRQEEAEKQIAALQRIRRERDNDNVRSALARVRQAATAEENVMPAVMDAVERHATVGEICGVLKDVFGTYQEPVQF